MEGKRKIPKGNFKHELFVITFLVVSATVSSCNEWTQKTFNHIKTILLLLMEKPLMDPMIKAMSMDYSYRIGLSRQESNMLGATSNPKKSNKIIAIPELIDLLYLKDAIVSIGVKGCQKKDC